MKLSEKLKDVIKVSGGGAHITQGVVKDVEALEEQLVSVTAENERLREERQEVLEVMKVAVARGEQLGFIEADNDYREKIAALEANDDAHA